MTRDPDPSIAPGEPAAQRSPAGSSPIARQVEIVKQLFDAFARRDIDSVLELFDPHVRFLPVTAQVARRGSAYEGHAGIREYMRDVERLWEQLELVPQHFEAVMGAVVVIGEVHARGSANEVNAPVVWTWRLCGERVIEGSVHSDLATARAALGHERSEAR